MSKPCARFPRSALYLLSLISLSLALLRPAAAQPALPQSSVLPPLRMPNLAVGTRCFGYLPCTPIDPFGLRLRAAALAVFRPEKGHDRDFYAARIQIVPAITLMKWAEVGVAIPITLYKKYIGVSTVYEPLEIYGRVRVPLESVLGGVSVTASGGLRLAYGPFAGGLPPSQPSESATPAAPLPDLMAQAEASYRKKPEVVFALAFSKHKGSMSFTGAIGTSVAVGRLEVSGGGELGVRLFKVVEVFVQGQGIGVLSCPPEEAALNFCAPGFRFGAGIRLDGDLGQFGMMIGTAGGPVEPGWAVGVQVGLDYDETTRWRHGDGVEAAQQWWERRFDAMARGWASWKSAAAVWEDEGEVARRVRPPRRGPFSDLPGAASPEPSSSPWLDALLGEDAPPPYPWLPEASSPPVTGTNTPGPTAAKGKPAPARKPPHRSLFAQANARAALARQIARAPRFAMPGSLELMTDEELAREQWAVIQEELRRAEQKQWRDSPDLPPVSKSLLNGLARVPYGMISPFFMGSPEGVRQVAELWERLRPVQYTPEEQQLGETMEEIVSFAGEVAATAGAGSLVKAETAGVRVAMRAGARQAAAQAGRQLAFEAVEQGTLGTAESLIPDASQLGGSRVSQFLARLNPVNYRLCGVNCGVGGIEFRPPRLPSAATAEVGAEVGEVESIAEHQTSPQTRVTGEGLEAQRKKFDTVRRRLWKEEARTNPEAYSDEDLAQMRKGNAPTGEDGEPMEWHHKKPLSEGGTNDRENLVKMTQTEHRLGPNYLKNHPR